jgi:DNA-binding CsgD family transcriptional regulator
VERVAEHLMAGTAVDRRTIDWLTRTADQLIVRAPQLAVILLRRALASADGETAPELRYHLVRALLWDGNASEAEQTARTALAGGGDPAREGVLRWLLVQACYRQGRLAEAQAAAGEALSSPHLTQGEIGRFHGFIALCLLVMLQFDPSEVAARKAITIGEREQDQLAIGYGYESLAGVRMMRGEFEPASELSDRALAAFGGGVQPDLQMDPYYVRGYCLVRLDRFAEADRDLATSVQQNLQSGGVYAALSSLVRARMRFLDGRWDDALAEIQTGVDSFDPYSYAVPMGALAALIAIHRGSHAADSEKVPVDDGSVGARSSKFMLVWAQALVEEAQAGAREALDLLYPVWADGGVMEHPRIIYDICPDLARLAAAAGDQDRVGELAVATQTLAAELPSGTTSGIARLCRGLADNDPDLLLAAAEIFGQAGRPLFEGYAYESGAAILAQRGQGGQAREALDKALALYTQLDAAWDIARLEARLRQAGIRRGVRGRRKRPKHGWEALTDTENKVVLLVAEGRSNPDIAAQMFLSRRTVQSHVSSILAKLSLSSRLELAISASRRSPA